MTNQHELEQDRRDYFLDKAEEDWEACWPDPPPALPNSSVCLRRDYADWLAVVLKSIIDGYDGDCSDITEHLMAFQYDWMAMRADKLEEEAEEDARQAQMDAVADRDLFDREDW